LSAGERAVVIRTLWGRVQMPPAQHIISFDYTPNGTNQSQSIRRLRRLVGFAGDALFVLGSEIVLNGRIELGGAIKKSFFSQSSDVRRKHNRCVIQRRILLRVVCIDEIPKLDYGRGPVVANEPSTLRS